MSEVSAQAHLRASRPDRHPVEHEDQSRLSRRDQRPRSGGRDDGKAEQGRDEAKVVRVERGRRRGPPEGDDKARGCRRAEEDLPRGKEVNGHADDAEARRQSSQVRNTIPSHSDTAAPDLSGVVPVTGKSSGRPASCRRKYSPVPSVSTARTPSKPATTLSSRPRHDRYLDGASRLASLRRSAPGLRVSIGAGVNRSSRYPCDPR